MNERIRIGCGAGFSGDRLEPALLLLQQANLDYLVLDWPAEPTRAPSQNRKRANPTQASDPPRDRRAGVGIDPPFNAATA